MANKPSSRKRAFSTLAVPCGNWRNLFFWCIARRAPEAINELAREVYPAYSSAFWKEADHCGPAQARFENGTTFHSTMARAWHADSVAKTKLKRKGNLRNSIAVRKLKLYGDVKGRILKWRERWRLEAEWVLREVLDTFAVWSYDRVSFAWKFDSSAVGTQINGLPKQQGQLIPWVLLRGPAEPNVSTAERRIRLIDLSWDALNARLTQPELNALFESALRQPLRGVELMAPKQDNWIINPVAIVDQHGSLNWISGSDVNLERSDLGQLAKRDKTAKLEYFEMLALYRCGKISPQAISGMQGELWYDLDEGAVREHIQKATKLLGGLPPIPVGRPRAKSALTAKYGESSVTPQR